VASSDSGMLVAVVQNCINFDLLPSQAPGSGTQAPGQLPLAREQNHHGPYSKASPVEEHFSVVENRQHARAVDGTK